MIDTIIITDTETTGLDPVTCQTIEVAAVAFDVRSRSVVEAFSSLMRAETNACESINRISCAALAAAPAADAVWSRICGMVGGARGEAAFMAHRAEFDRGFYPRELAERLPWVCSKFDVEWPHSKPGSSCVEMALAHGVPVVSAHRALTDAMLIAKTLESVGNALPELLARAMRPRVLVRVADTRFDEARNALAKAAGFQWQKPHWVRRMAREDVAALPFAVQEIS